MTRVVLGIGLVIAIVGMAYCVLGMIQLASYSAGPNYPKELATQHFGLWILGMGVSITVGLFCLVLLWKTKNKLRE
jgi:membrane-bound ClpP family serine protease